MRSIGICVGASTLSAAVLRDGILEQQRRIVHEGNPREHFLALLQELDPEPGDPVALTGRDFKDAIHLSAISETEAIEMALRFRTESLPFPLTAINGVISAGGETFLAYELGREGRINRVQTGNKCASGTGEFFLQQIRRMNVSLEQAVEFSQDQDPHPVSGRCSVFCKSDCTHATNKGVPRGQVVAGLCSMMADKILELLRQIPREKLVLIGGTTLIKPFVTFLEEKIDDLIIPEEALVFEALGTAVWAASNPTLPMPKPDQLFQSFKSQFAYHPPLAENRQRVRFETMARGVPTPGDVCILGLDVGSTTTKAVLLRESDQRILAAEYLRTNGDPIQASRNCYKALREQLGDCKLQIRGLGVTGSGRKIAGLHALTDAVYNEIIAHAEAAVYFDPEVDTIFEIGGQDAKYTYLVNGVASDYAMNEACSAGTGSFLEEAAKETLGIEMENIAGIAFQGETPPNFNDQCAAFISSDIKNAFNEGISRENVVAGLVYSICLNYVNRVKGARPVGRKIFMQGGVCYNAAVPVAMATLADSEIIVPPEPGLMGAFGVALETSKRLKEGLLAQRDFSLDQLIRREVSYKPEFICPGGREKCDLGCEVNRIVIEGKTYPFGGSCNRYYNIRHKIKTDPGALDYVQRRSALVYDEFAARAPLIGKLPRVGILASFLTNTYYPLFSHLFTALGYEPVLVDHPDPEGMEKVAAPFCFPAELSHGFLQQALTEDLDLLFLPQIKGAGVDGVEGETMTCPLVQGEPYYLPATFDELAESQLRLLQPVLRLDGTAEQVAEGFFSIGEDLGISRASVLLAFKTAWAVQMEMRAAFHALGREALSQVASDPETIGVVLSGRPYNAYTPVANKGIPHKFASRGVAVIPVDFLDLGEQPVQDHMYWSMGQLNLKAAALVRQHPQLFGTFITNFSCGPDSFVIGYYRDVMGDKPSLTLELDNHTADAGLETRIEAFLDIVQRYRNLQQSDDTPDLRSGNGFHPARVQILDRSTVQVEDSHGQRIDFHDPRVRVVFPSMGRYSSEVLAAVLEGMGIRSLALPTMEELDLKAGRANSTCKECLPLQLTVGALLRYLEQDRPAGELTVYFMPQADGPCRFGQYQDFMQAHVRKHEIRDVAFLSLTSSNGYAGMGQRFALDAMGATIIADAMEDIHYAMQLNTADPATAQVVVEECWQEILTNLKREDKEDLARMVVEILQPLQQIPRLKPLEELPTILMVGEIYVRKEGLSRRWLPERLLKSGLLTHTAPIHEWAIYIDWLVQQRILSPDAGWQEMLRHRIKQWVVRRRERRIKRALATSGWYTPRFVDIEHVLHMSSQFINPQLSGEAVLTTGGPLAEVGREFCGAIAIGPFGCMPNRLSESILNQKMKSRFVLDGGLDPVTARVFENQPELPFLAIESDGNPFPPLIRSRLENFVVQARRMHNAMLEARETPEVQE